MTKLKNVTKKSLMVIMAVLMVLFSLPITQVFADTSIGDVLSVGDNVNISVSWHYGHELHTTTINGKTYPLFCIEYGTTSPSTSHVVGFKSGTERESTLNAAKWIFAGYFMEHGDNIDWLDMAYCQKKVWDLTGRDTSWDFSSSGYNVWLANARQNMDKIDTFPSFDSTNVGTIVAGKSISITDSNGVLKDYPAFTQNNDGIKIEHSENSNKLTITISKDCTKTSFSLEGSHYKEFTGIDNGLVRFYPNGSSSYQKLIYSAYYDPVDLHFNGNIIPLGEIELTKADNWGANVNGAVFGLYTDKACTNRIATATTSGGKIKFEYLEPDTYYIKEISAPTGFLLSDEVNKVTVKSNNTASENRKNDEPRGTITLTKQLDTSKTNGRYGDVVIGEAEYTLYAKEKITSKLNSHTYYNKDAVIGTKNIVINSDGKSGTVTWSGLPLGSYYVKETRNPRGTFTDTNTYNVTLSYKDQNSPVVVHNSSTSTDVVKYQRAKIFKAGTDGNSGLLAGLEGTEFTIKLYADVQKALQAGYSYSAIWNGSANSIAPTYDVVTTNKWGDALTRYLPYGQYIVKETKTPQDYQPSNDFTFSITQCETEIANEYYKTKNLNVNNAPFKSYIKVVKRDRSSGKAVTLSSATFKIKATEDIKDYTTGEIVYHSGDFVTYKVGNNRYNEFMTNSDGYVTAAEGGVYASKNDNKGSVLTPFMLQTGAYEIVEVKEPNGFLISESNYPFIVTTVLGYDTDEDNDPVITVTATNEQPKGKLTITKEFTLRENMNLSLIDVDYTKVVFKVSAAEDIVDMADGTIVYEKGQTIGEYNLNENGTVTIDNLWIGKYTVNEVETIDGGVLDTADYDVSYEVTDNTTKAYKKDLKINNKTTEIDFTKTDITGDKELEGAELEVTDSKGNVIDSWTSTTEAHKIEGLVVGKTYTLSENLAPLGYAVANSIEFTVANTDEIQKVAMLDKVVFIDKQCVNNDRINGTELTVTDTANNEVDKWIVGQHIIDITDNLKEEVKENETVTITEETTSDNIIQYTISSYADTEDYLVVKIIGYTADYYIVDTEGNEVAHMCRGLEEGKSYILSETKTMDGYVTATPVNFDVTGDKENQSIIMVDKTVTVSKTSVTGDKELEGAELTVTDNEGNIIDKWTSTTEAHNIVGLVEGKKYTLTENLAPLGYAVANSIEFTVSYEKQNELINMIDKQVTVSKVDITNNKELEGAELEVTDSKGNVIDSWTSTTDVHYVNGLVEGQTYTLTETTAPYGYDVTESIEFTVSDDKETQAIVMKDAPFLSSVRVVKCDKTTKNVIKSNEFEFSIYADKKCKDLISTSGANKDEGTALFEDLRWGTYYIKETKAPIGYSLSDQVVEVVINEEGVFADGVNLEEKDGIYSFEYYDELLPVVKTGDNINKKLIIIGVLLVLFIGVFILVSKKMKKK